MKSILTLFTVFSLLLIGFSINAQSKSAVAPAVKGVHMTFDKEHIKLGNVNKGEKRTFDFTFTNTGTETIEIEIVSGCDCTTLDWPRKPIKPGGKGTINVIFDSTEKEDSDPVDVDIYLKNLDPKTGQQILKIINYSYNLIK